VKRSNPVEDVIGRDINLVRSGKVYRGLCPFHKDHNPSLTVDPARQRWKCWACGAEGDVIDWVKSRRGLATREAIDALAGTKTRDRKAPAWVTQGELVAVHSYTNEAGEELYQRRRFRMPDGGKEVPCGRVVGGKFRGTRYSDLNAPEVLYRLHEIRAAVRAASLGDQPPPTVYLHEGEKPADRCRSAGHLSTSSRLGATGLNDPRPRWRAEYSAQLAGCSVVIVADNDQQGIRHARMVARLLNSAKIPVTVVKSRTDGMGDDAYDHFEAGFDVEDMQPSDADFGEGGEEASITAHSAPDRPRIAINRELREVTDDALEALRHHNDPPRIFVRDGSLVRVQKDEKDRHFIRPLGVAQLRNELAQAANWCKGEANNTRPAYPPKDVAENILAEGSLIKGFPILEGLAAAPVLAQQSGKCRREYGYDPHTRWFITGRGPWPVWPGSAHDAADWILTEVFGDFPFADAASRANALALFLLPFVRSLINGPTPIHFVDSPMPGTGKGMLIKAALMPGLGCQVAMTPVPNSEEELAKLLFAMLLQGEQAICFDNLRRTLESSALESCLTTTQYRSRVLGASQTVSVPVTAIFALTANNGQLTRDSRRRCVSIRLDAQSEHPEERGNWRHADLLGFVEEHLAILVAAAIAICEHWANCESPQGPRQKASYTSYSRVMGGILTCCGITDFLANDEAFRAEASNEDDEWRPFYREWLTRFGVEPVTVKDLCHLAREKELLGGILEPAKSERGTATILGRALTGRISVILDGLHIQKSTPAHGFSRFKMDRTTALGELGEPPPASTQVGIPTTAESRCPDGTAEVHLLHPQVQPTASSVHLTAVDATALGEHGDRA
jgi:hypothetical protein